MWRDPIVEEVRGNRAAHAARFDHDLEAICHAAREAQKRSLHEVVSLPPRRVHEANDNEACIERTKILPRE